MTIIWVQKQDGGWTVELCYPESEAAAGTQGEFISLVWCGRHPDAAQRDPTAWLGM